MYLNKGGTHLGPLLTPAPLPLLAGLRLRPPGGTSSFESHGMNIATLNASFCFSLLLTSSSSVSLKSLGLVGPASAKPWKCDLFS